MISDGIERAFSQRNSVSSSSGSTTPTGRNLGILTIKDEKKKVGKS